MPPELTTPRLRLRGWTEADWPAFAAMNADPEVRRYFPSTLTRAESDASAAAIQAHIEREGFGFWALELTGAAPFIGFCGLKRLTMAAHFTPAIEIGWRLAHEHWGRGYATESARAALRAAFGPLNLSEVVAQAAASNTASRRVMERIGMRHDPQDDFDHPDVSPGPLQRHVLYRIQAK